MKKRKPAAPADAAPETTSIRWQPDDLVLLRRLRESTGMHNVSELVRQGLRALAKKEGLR